MSIHGRTCSALALAGALLAPATALADPPPFLQLTGTIRDFNDTHPDFESVIAFDPGIVSAWHMHRRATERLFCGFGRLRLVLFDGREGESDAKNARL